LREKPVQVETSETIDGILSRHGTDRTRLVEILHDLQHERGYLPEDALRSVADRLGVPLIEVYRVATFYKTFTLQPRGRHVLTLCTGTACHVRGSPKLLDEVQGLYGISPGETTADGTITLETVNCLGACALGPVAVLDETYHHHMSPARLKTLLATVDNGTGKE
jgi:NADH:ubiquinone oxidoreductase subunit E